MSCAQRVLFQLLSWFTNMSRNRSNDSTPPTSTSNAFGTPLAWSDMPTSTPSACRGKVCPSMLTIAQEPSGDSIHFFARGTDAKLWYREATPYRWNSEWTSLGGTVNFVSSPIAVSRQKGRVDLFGVIRDKTMRTKSYQNGAWDAQWANMGGEFTSSPASCSSGPGRLDLWAVNSSSLLQHKWYDNGKWNPSLDGEWQHLPGHISSNPVAVSGAVGRFDLAVYTKDNSPFRVSWRHHVNGVSSAWQPQPPKSGLLVGDPALVALSADRTDFLGIGHDNAMYWQSWTRQNNYTDLKSLGSSFQSVAGLLATGGNRIDVVAVGTDDKLKHNSLIRDTWGNWEDLGGYFNSAPLVMRQGDFVSVFGLGPDGSMIHGNWSFPAGDERSWGEGSWFSDGGTFATIW